MKQDTKSTGVTVVLYTLWRLLWSITVHTHAQENVIHLFYLYNKNSNGLLKILRDVWAVENELKLWTYWSTNYVPQFVMHRPLIHAFGQNHVKHFMTLQNVLNRTEYRFELFCLQNTSFACLFFHLKYQIKKEWPVSF